MENENLKCGVGSVCKQCVKNERELDDVKAALFAAAYKIHGFLRPAAEKKD